MFANKEDLHRYIIENYTHVTDDRIDDDHWDLFCAYCKMTRGFQVIKREMAGVWSTRYSPPKHPHNFDRDFDMPVTYLFKCPVCKAFKQWIIYEVYSHDEAGKSRTYYFRATSVPGEGLEDIDELPVDPPSLRTAYREAIRAADANAHLAAATMFRRALHVITRELLGAKPGMLANELKEVVGKTYNGVVITQSFADVGYIIKEAGNQGAHPDKDPDLLEFTAQDAQDLQNIFMELVSELFVIPVAKEKARADFKARRKIGAKSS